MKKIHWSERFNEAFNEMKNALQTPPILTFPDFNKQFILDTDASFDTIGAVLSQLGDDGYERVIAYGSHSMNSHEKGYCVTRKELLAVYYFSQHFNHYLYGRRFTLRTDHKAITFMTQTKKPITSQYQTWINYISSLDIQMEYRKGVEHSNADALSRKICGTCTQCLMTHENPKTEKNRTRTINTVQGDDLRTKDKTNIGREKRKENNEQSTEEDERTKIWIPDDKREETITKTHKMLCHLGSEKTWKYLAENYDMTDMRNVTKKVVRNCEACQRVKPITAKTKEDTIKIAVGKPFEKVYIDICGPLRETLRKKKYIIAIIDQYSRYISLTATSRQDEETVKKTILTNWILKMGAPRVIHADCGRVFESKTMKDMAAERNITICLSSPYHHNTNGLIERQFRTIRDCINTAAKDNTRKDWEELLPEIEFAMNATYQKSIGMSPCEMVFGRKIFRERWYIKEDTSTEDQSYEDMQTKRRFSVGDEVLVKKMVRNKNEDRFEGPYEVCEKIHNRRYKLQDDKGKIIQRNVEQLRPWIANYKTEQQVQS